MGHESLLQLVIFVFYLSVVCSNQKSTNRLTVPFEDVVEVLKRNIKAYHHRDDTRSVAMRVKAVTCLEVSKPCKIEYEPMSKREAILIVRQHIPDNVSSLIDHELLFWLLDAGGLKFGILKSFRWNVYRTEQTEPLTLLKMLTAEETRTSMGRIFDNATTLAANYVFSQRFAELAHCFVSLGTGSDDVHHFKTVTILQCFFALVFPYWLKMALYQVKNDPKLSDIFGKQMIETEIQIANELPPVRLANRTKDFETPIVMQSFFAHRFLQKTALMNQLKCELEKLKNEYSSYQNSQFEFDGSEIVDDLFLQNSEKLINGTCTSDAWPLKFRRIVNAMFPPDNV